ncbi:MAG: hypothetical protein Q9188_007206 [Gyalolechia gomerana]
MAPNNPRQQRQDRNQSTVNEVSQEEERCDSDSSISPTYSSLAEELARNSRGIQIQHSSQRAFYYATPTPTPAPPPAATPAVTPATAPPAPTAIMPAVIPADTPAPIVAPIAAPTPVPTPAVEAVPLTSLTEHPAQTSTESNSRDQNGGTLVPEASSMKKRYSRKRMLIVGGLLWTTGVAIYNLYCFPPNPTYPPNQLSANNLGFRTRSGHSVIEETDQGADLLSDMHLLAINSSHGIRDPLLRLIHNARLHNHRAGSSSQTFHYQTVNWSLYLSQLQHELTGIGRPTGHPTLTAVNTIKFLTIPGNPKPYNLFTPLSLSQAPDQAIRQHILHAGKDLLTVWKGINSSAHHYADDVKSWEKSVKHINPIFGPTVQRYSNLKREIAKEFCYFSGKDQEKARLQKARQTDKHIMQLRETDKLLCRAMKHLNHVQQGSNAAISEVKDVWRVLTDLMRECATGGTCSTFPNQLRLSGAKDEEIDKYGEEAKNEEDVNNGEDADDEEGYVRCVVM